MARVGLDPRDGDEVVFGIARKQPDLMNAWRPGDFDAQHPQRSRRQFEGQFVLFGLGERPDRFVCQFLKSSQLNGTFDRLGGQLSKGRTPYDLMRATFPAGTLSGAPKIRAMQIIAELEQTQRGPYGGCVGYFSFNGNLDCCITIRTALLKDGQAYVQAFIIRGGKKLKGEVTISGAKNAALPLMAATLGSVITASHMIDLHKPRGCEPRQARQGPRKIGPLTVLPGLNAH
jgi:hypothetical protein